MAAVDIAMRDDFTMTTPEIDLRWILLKQKLTIKARIYGWRWFCRLCCGIAST